MRPQTLSTLIEINLHTVTMGRSLSGVFVTLCVFGLQLSGCKQSCKNLSGSNHGRKTLLLGGAWGWIIFGAFKWCTDQTFVTHDLLTIYCPKYGLRLSGDIVATTMLSESHSPQPGQ